MAIDIEKKKIRDRAYSKRYYRLNKAKKQAYARKRDKIISIIKYGITLDDYNTMLREQNCCCAICGKHKLLFKIRMFIDHCHITGKVRGLLCRNCNMGIGLLKENVESLKKAIKYLEQ